MRRAVGVHNGGFESEYVVFTPFRSPDDWKHRQCGALIDAVWPASQVVLRMHYLEGLTHFEIAEALELAIGTVKSRLAYALAGLRTELARRQSAPRGDRPEPASGDMTRSTL
jgi:DNA-directed RNA polymerase specialized sigma24 family protein